MFTRRSLLAGLAALPLSARADGDFRQFLAQTAQQARRAGVSSRVIAAAFRGLTPDARVIAHDQTQPELTLTWPQYRARMLIPARIQAGRSAFAANVSLLRTIGAVYGVDPRIICAIWGIESSYGTAKGHFKLIRSLATLAWQGRRAAYFTNELIAALKILAAGYATPAMLSSGWAGAMGQPQFMPSVYLKSAVDFDGDGKRDIWNNPSDSFASIANYLVQHGWQRGGPWAELIAVPPANNLAPANLAPGDRVLLPSGAPPDQTFLIHPNFDVIERYNPSDFYALAVGLLADALA
jgi:membrane-bound lytic murein transglycosylase B